MSTPLHQLSSEQKLLRRSNSNDIFGHVSPEISQRLVPNDYRAPRSRASGITAAGRAIYVGAGSSRGTEININIFGDQESPEVERERHETRLAAALGIDRCAKVLSFGRGPVGKTTAAIIDIWSHGRENCWYRFTAHHDNG